MLIEIRDRDKKNGKKFNNYKANFYKEKIQ